MWRTWVTNYLKQYDSAFSPLSDIEVGKIAEFASWLEENAAEQSVHLTAYRRGLWVSICVNIVLLLVVASTFGGR